MTTLGRRGQSSRRGDTCTCGGRGLPAGASSKEDAVCMPVLIGGETPKARRNSSASRRGSVKVDRTGERLLIDIKQRGLEIGADQRSATAR